jgi:hypothetical protein
MLQKEDMNEQAEVIQPEGKDIKSGKRNEG